MASQKPVKDLVQNEAIMYKGRKYKVDDVSSEGLLKTLRLSSLTYPREIVLVLWHPDSMVTYSNLKTTKHTIVKYISGSTFKVSDHDQSEWSIPQQHIDCITGLLNSRTICLPIHECFGQNFPGIVYALSNVSRCSSRVTSRSSSPSIPDDGEDGDLNGRDCDLNGKSKDLTQCSKPVLVPATVSASRGTLSGVRTVSQMFENGNSLECDKDENIIHGTPIFEPKVIHPNPSLNALKESPLIKPKYCPLGFGEPNQDSKIKLPPSTYEEAMNLCLSCSLKDKCQNFKDACSSIEDLPQCLSESTIKTLKMEDAKEEGRDPKMEDAKEKGRSLMDSLYNKPIIKHVKSIPNLFSLGRRLSQNTLEDDHELDPKHGEDHGSRRE